MVLYIDTTDFNKVTFGLVTSSRNMDSGSKAGMTHRKLYKIDPSESHRAVAKLEEFLKGSRIKLSHIKKIIVNKGPGSFTGVRIGVVMAQALGFVWNIPVKAVAKDKFKII